MPELKKLWRESDVFDRDCIPIVTGYALVTGILIGTLTIARVLV